MRPSNTRDSPKVGGRERADLFLVPLVWWTARSHKTQLSHTSPAAPPLPTICIMSRRVRHLPWGFTGLGRIRARLFFTHRSSACNAASSKASLPCTTACTLLQGLPMSSQCFHSKKSSKSVCKAAQGSLSFPGRRTGSSAGSLEPALRDTSRARSSSDRAPPAATHIAAILQTPGGKEMKLRLAVFTKNQSC